MRTKAGLVKSQAPDTMMEPVKHKPATRYYAFSANAVEAEHLAQVNRYFRHVFGSILTRCAVWCGWKEQ